MSAAQKLKQRLFSAPSSSPDAAGGVESLKIDIPGARPATPSSNINVPRPTLQAKRAENGNNGSGLVNSDRNLAAVAVEDPEANEKYGVNGNGPTSAEPPKPRVSYRQRVLNKLGTQYSSVEEHRLDQDRARERHWKRWGPYLSERQWATVREDYSSNGDAWTHFPHEHARSRAYRWGEDGIGGVSDNHGRLCWSLALWNGEDDILKERLFGVTGHQGNHGEDVKELYYYLDSTVSKLLWCWFTEKKLMYM